MFPEKTFALDSKLAMDKTCPSELRSAVEDDHACEKKQFVDDSEPLKWWQVYMPEILSFFMYYIE